MQVGQVNVHWSDGSLVTSAVAWWYETLH